MTINPLPFPSGSGAGEMVNYSFISEFGIYLLPLATLDSLSRTQCLELHRRPACPSLVPQTGDGKSVCVCVCVCVHTRVIERRQFNGFPLCLLVCRASQSHYSPSLASLPCVFLHPYRLLCLASGCPSFGNQLQCPFLSEASPQPRGSVRHACLVHSQHLCDLH